MWDSHFWLSAMLIFKPRIFSSLQTLFLSSRSLVHSLPLFSVGCGLFCKNTRVGGYAGGLAAFGRRLLVPAPV